MCLNELLLFDYIRNLRRKILRKMVEGKTNSEALGEVIVVEADDGTTALKELQRAMETDGKGFDIVLIDYVMTAMNGPEAVKIMRNDLRYSGTVIGVTGNALPEDIFFFESSGADCVVTKPLTNKKLMQAIDMARNKSRSLP